MKNNKLHSIKDSGFRTPKNYFSGLEDSILSQIKIQEKTEQTGFKVPDDYFESIDDKILDKVATKPKVISLFTKQSIIYATSIAAALLLLIGYFFNNDDLTFEDLETASIESYISDVDFTSYEIGSLLTEDELITDNFIDSEFNSDDLQDYLLQNATIEDLIIE